MGIFDRIFRRQPEGKEERTTGCYICGAPAQYHCDMCGKLICAKHTVVGTATCVNCHEAAHAYVDRR
mgnify:CR=1 FL=1